MKRKLIGVLLCSVMAVWLVLAGLEERLLRAGILNKKDMPPFIGNETGTVSEYLLNIWHWDGMLLLLMLAAGPCFILGAILLKTERVVPRRRFRYGLRHLLLAMLLVALISAGVRWYSSAAPDLIITDVIFQPAKPAVGEPVGAIIFYRNAGRKTAANFYLHQSEPIGRGWGLGGGELKPGESAECGWGGMTFNTAGRHKLVFAIDPEKTVPEVNETNNVYTTYLDIQERE